MIAHIEITGGTREARIRMAQKIHSESNAIAMAIGNDGEIENMEEIKSLQRCSNP